MQSRGSQTFFKDDGFEAIKAEQIKSLLILLQSVLVIFLFYVH